MREPAFSDTWYEVFGRPDPEITAREVAFLLEVLPPPPATVLDAPCGSGRHAIALLRQGYEVTGVDIEPRVIAAAQMAGVAAHELDMRSLRDLPGRFDAVICMWASFGWFDEATNAEVFAQLADKIQTGGVFVLDVFDPTWFRAHQGPHTIERRGHLVAEHKHVDGSRLHTTLDYADGSRDEFDWQLYEPSELAGLGEGAGLRCELACADFDLDAAPHGEVARMQLVFRRH